MHKSMSPPRAFRAALPCAIAALLLFPLHPAACQRKKSVAKRATTPIERSLELTARAFPNVTIDSLSNGMRVLFCRVNDLPLMEITLMIDAGIMREAVGAEGIAQLMGKLIFSGTPKRTRNDIVSDLSTLASTLNSSTGYENTRLIMRCLARNFLQSIDILADLRVFFGHQGFQFIHLFVFFLGDMRRNQRLYTESADLSTEGEEHYLLRFSQIYMGCYYLGKSTAHIIDCPCGGAEC